MSNVSFHPDGKLLGFIGDANEIGIWDMFKKKVVIKIRTKEETIFNLRFTSNGKTIVVSGKNGVSFYDLRTGKYVYGLPHAGVSSSFDLHGNLLAIGDGAGGIQLWDIPSKKQIFKLATKAVEVTAIQFSPDGKRLLSGGLDDAIVLWDIRTGTKLRTIYRPPIPTNEEHRIPHTEAVFSPDGNAIAFSLSNNAVIDLYDSNSGAKLRTLGDHPFFAKSVVFSENAEFLGMTTYLYGREADGFQKWNLNLGVQKSSFELQCDESLILSSDGKLLAGTCKGKIVVSDSATGKILTVIEDPEVDLLTVIKISPDNERLAEIVKNFSNNPTTSEIRL